MDGPSNRTDMDNLDSGLPEIGPTFERRTAYGNDAALFGG
jgi:hypothetical protein